MDIRSIEHIAITQKSLIARANLAGKPVITATQMLESMVASRIPTRAEATDVANAIYDGTSAIMLSGETSVGKYPVESLLAMSKIAVETERDIDYVKRFNEMHVTSSRNVTNAVSRAACARTGKESFAVSASSERHNLPMSAASAMARNRGASSCPIRRATFSRL